MQETVKLSFDENVISFEKILELFLNFMIQHRKICNFQMLAHNIEVEIFYENEQQEIANKVKEKFNKVFNNKIETKISPIKNYCRAEEYHQKYIEKTRK